MPAGERGEIVLRGPKVFKGYWRDPDATAAAFAGGWFHTGDIGVRDEDGYLFIVDRLKDMIVSGGENIAGSEVERVLYEHEAVLEAAVVGRPDDRWGEVPVAFVVLRPGRDRHAGARSSSTAAPSWRASRSRRRSSSSTRCRGTRPARCSNASCGAGRALDSPEVRDDLGEVHGGPDAGLRRADRGHRVDRPVRGDPGRGGCPLLGRHREPDVDFER